jgi:hypothetical protein
MQLPQTLRGARDAFLATAAFYDIKPTTITFESPVIDGCTGILPIAVVNRSPSERSPAALDHLPNVSASGWCVTPHWIEAGPDDVRPGSEYCIVLESADEDSRLVIDHGSAVVVTEHGECYPLVQPAWFRECGESEGPTGEFEIDGSHDEEWLVAVLQWGSEELTKRAEDCILDRAALTEGLAQLRIVVENLGMPARLHQFHYCVNGDHPEMPGAEVVFCELRQRTVTRLPVADLPSVQGWIIQCRRPEGAFTPAFVLTTAGDVLPLDLDVASTKDLAMPPPLPDTDTEDADTGAQTYWSGDDRDDLLAARESTLEWLPLESAVSS